MYTVEVSLPSHKRGDAWIGIAQIGPVLINGSAPENPLARIRMQMRLDRFVFTFDSEEADRDAPIEITDAAEWKATIPQLDSADFLQKVGDYSWDMEFYGYFADPEQPLTFYQGTFTVEEDITKPAST